MITVSIIVTSGKNLFAGRSQNESVLPLSYIATVLVNQRRVRIDNTILYKVSQRKDISWEIQFFEPSFTEAKSAVLNKQKATFSVIRL